MELYSPTPNSTPLRAPRALADRGQRADEPLRDEPAQADAPPRSRSAGGSAAADRHDDTLVPAALVQIQLQCVNVELLLEAGVLGRCLSD